MDPPETAAIAVAASLVAAGILVGLLRAAEAWTDRRLLLVLAALAGAHLALVALQPRDVPLSDATLLGAAAAAGLLVGRLLETRGAARLFLVTIAVVDVVSFSLGPAAAILDAVPSNPALLAAVALVVVTPSGLLGVAAIGDLVALATLYVALPRLGVPGPLAVVAPTVGLLGAIAVAAVVGPLPALPAIALGAAVALVLADRRPALR